MNIIFEYNTKRLILPVNPESLAVNIPSPSQKIDVIGLGQVSIPQEAQLATISIQSFLWKYLFDSSMSRLVGAYVPLSEGMSSAISTLDNKVASVLGKGFIDDSKKFKLLDEYIKWFQEWRDSKKPARFTVVSSPLETPYYFDFDVTCENIQYEIRAGEESDYYYKLELLEWKDYGAQEVETRQENGKVVATPKTPARLSTKPALEPKITAKATDSLWSIAQKNSKGELEGWKTLYNIAENKSPLANNLNNLSGITLKMPKDWLK